jgi:hypothetical protein
LGYWIFERPIRSLPPTITGSRGDGEALANLLEALAADGQIIDETEP